MVKNSKLWVIAVLFLLILVAVELVHHYLFNQAYRSKLLECINSSPELAQACVDSVSNSGNAFHYATISHFLTYFAIFGIFLILSSRLSSLDRKIVNHQQRSND